MRRDIAEKLEIPAGIEVEVSKEDIKIKKGGKEIKRVYEGFEIKKEGSELVISKIKSTKKEKKQIKTLKAHIINAFNGLTKKHEYRLQVCALHFPMNVSLDKAKNEVIIKNFLGEVKPRIAKIIPGVEVKIEKDIITVSGENRETAGQSAANIEKATRITNRDRRTFQDGIFLIEKPEGKI